MEIRSTGTMGGDFLSDVMDIGRGAAHAGLDYLRDQAHPPRDSSSVVYSPPPAPKMTGIKMSPALLLGGGVLIFMLLKRRGR